MAKLFQQRALARSNQSLRASFEVAELRLREAKNRDEWWKAICFAAENLGFLRVEVRLAGGVDRDLVWEREGASVSAEPKGQVSIPVRQPGTGAPLQIHLEVPVPDSIESAGNGVMLFGRLLDSYGRIPG